MEKMTVQNVRIYLLPLTRRSLNYAAAQKYSRTRTDGVLVMSNVAPDINGTVEIKERGRLSKAEQEWICFALADMMYAGKKRNRFEEFWRFLDRLEAALNDMEKGGVQDGERADTGEQVPGV